MKVHRLRSTCHHFLNYNWHSWGGSHFTEIWSIYSLCLAVQLVGFWICHALCCGSATWIIKTHNRPKIIFFLHGTQRGMWLTSCVFLLDEIKLLQSGCGPSPEKFSMPGLFSWLCFCASECPLRLRSTNSLTCVAKKADFQLERNHKPIQWYLCEYECSPKGQPCEPVSSLLPVNLQQSCWPGSFEDNLFASHFLLFYLCLCMYGLQVNQGGMLLNITKIKGKSAPSMQNP